MRFIYSIQRSFIEYRVNLRKLWKLSLFKNYKISQFLPKITYKYNINLQGSLRYELRWEFLYFPWVVYSIAHNSKGIEWEILKNSKLFLNPVHIVLERKHDLTRGWLVLFLAGIWQRWWVIQVRQIQFFLPLIKLGFEGFVLSLSSFLCQLHQHLQEFFYLLVRWEHKSLKKPSNLTSLIIVFIHCITCGANTLMPNTVLIFF